MNLMIIYKLFIPLFCIIINYIEANDEISVTVKPKIFNGLKKTIDGKEIDYFLGIPYAEPPIGKLRFKKPKPFKYDQPINATKWPNVCYQNADIKNPLYMSHNMSEDCLYLNIWSPKISKELKPVMFWIHGGALTGGSASFDIFNAEILTSRGDVVVVTINYRLQSLGFLYTGTDDAPGNVGLLDQALALQWVKDNIATFGGDPEQVTIFGESAGSWSVGLHLLSPISRHLYKNAIMMSAGPLNHMTGEHPDRARNNWLKVAKFAECGDGLNFTSAVIECLMKISPEKLVKDRKDLTTDTAGIMSQVRYGDEFLPERPLDMLMRGDYKKNVRLLAGFTDDEGSWILADRVDPIKYSHTTPANLTKTQAYEELKSLAHKLITPFHSVNGDDVAKLYLSRLPNTDYDTIRRTMGIALGDYYITCTTMLFAKALYESDKSQTKVYQYFFTGKLGVFAESFCSKWQGTCHASDLIPVFGYPLRIPQFFSPEEKEVSKKMIDSFTHFAKKGYPPTQEGIEWPEYYTVNNHVIQHYYEFSNHPKPEGNFGYGLKTEECEKLWAPYIYG